MNTGAKYAVVADSIPSFVRRTTISKVTNSLFYRATSDSDVERSLRPSLRVMLAHYYVGINLLTASDQRILCWDGTTADVIYTTQQSHNNSFLESHYTGQNLLSYW